MGWDGMGWDGMGWDGMGWDGMGCDAVRCGAMRCDAVRCEAVQCGVMRSKALEYRVPGSHRFTFRPGSSPPLSPPQVLADKDNFERRIVKEPVGVVLSIAPWNYPLLCQVNSVVPAVLAGNAAVIKQSPRAPLCAEAFERAFRKAGAPAGLVTALHADNDAVGAAIEEGPVDFVSFTGSVAAGRTVYELCARAPGRFLDCTLELGGKDPMWVLGR